MNSTIKRLQHSGAGTTTSTGSLGTTTESTLFSPATREAAVLAAVVAGAFALAPRIGDAARLLPWLHADRIESALGYLLAIIVLGFAFGLFCWRRWQALRCQVREQARREADHQDRHARNAAVLAATPDVIFRFNRDGECLDFITANPAGTVAPLAPELAGQRVDEIMPPHIVPLYHQAIAQTLDSGTLQTIEYQLSLPQGTQHFEARFVVSGENDVIGIVREVTERKEAERQLRHLALHDPLTNLPTSTLFVDRVERALARAIRQQTQSAILFVDLDRFKVINESLGHQLGDQLLATVARRLQGCLRPEDTLVRLGADEFTILLEDVHDVYEAIRVAERLLQAVQAPFTLSGGEVFITASIGVALSSLESRGNPDDLLRNADAAMQRAKQKGRGCLEVFDTSMSTRAAERLELETSLRRAIERGELRVYYQPKVELATGRVEGLEALVRWEHPVRGLVSPAEFIPLAEETGLILPIGRWVLEKACRQVWEWQVLYPGEPALTMSVNLSARQFQQPDLVADIADVLQETGVAAEHIQLEITESVVMEDAESTIVTMQKLKELGVQLSIDDFGTGYSSLAYLKRFPVDTLKIDKGFVAGLGHNPEDTAIVQAVIMLAHTMGLLVVAEGVETAEDVERLRVLGCDVGQGYYYARPLARADANTLLANALAATQCQTRVSAAG